MYMYVRALLNEKSKAFHLLECIWKKTFKYMHGSLTCVRYTWWNNKHYTVLTIYLCFFQIAKVFAFIHLKNLFYCCVRLVPTKEVNKEQPSYRNLSATATRVLQCTFPVPASRKYFSAINTSPHLTSTHLTPDYVNTIILHLVSVLYTAVNVSNKN